ncbi:Glyoxalase-like domain-containing protein [Marinobacter daqiaonensis]|uniref:Glyoxalase-like domain-containing protein n=1 Tax=Marinobacter daqiaonensis TaxID=650891 RepID=A0A1I6JDJ4_9GAMM|nr:VOC family protein [Marinobacter daqiaonensis]SFR76969.1 Glyoxalase-like domain-containing protein [Marinobacter daqiaonensis]
MYLRQICLVAPELNPTVEALSELFSIPVCHRDPEVAAFGLENAILAVGSQFLEVVAPIREGTAAGRFMERRGSGGGYMVICQVSAREDQARVRHRARARGVRLAYEADHQSWNIMQLHPADMKASFLEVDWDSQADPEGNWEPAGGLRWRESVCAEVTTAITALELSGPEPQALAAHWADVTGLPLENQDGLPCLVLANATLRFSRAAEAINSGLVAADLKIRDRSRLYASAAALGIEIADEQVHVGGMRFNLV